MILFFAWTDIQLINCVNTKCNYYKTESADLLLYNCVRVSERLVEIIRRKKIFSNIYTIEVPDLYKENKKTGISKIFLFLNRFKQRKYFLEEINHIFTKKKYEIFIVAAFWSETLNIFKCLRKYNKEIFIEIVEEGMANYDGSKNWIFRTAPASNIESIIRGLFYCRNLGITAKRRVRCFYLYRQEISWTHLRDKVHKLPVVSKKNNPVLYEIFEAWHEITDDSLYRKSKYIFIADAPCYKKNSQDILKDLIKVTPQIIKENSIIKLHPLYSTYIKENVALSEEKMWIDSREAPIETILFQCDMDHKVLIINRSSSLLYVKCMLDKEPYVVLTYKIQPHYEKEEKERFDYFVTKLKGVFENPNKIIIPGTLEDFQIVLKTIDRNITL